MRSPVIKSKLAPLSMLAVAREVRKAAGDHKPLTVSGARELVPLLAKELRAGGDPSAVREHGSPKRAAALVWIGDADEEALRRASTAGVPIVGVTEGAGLPYVFDTDLVRLQPGHGFPVDEIARAVARALGDEGTGLAARLPVLREAVVDELIRLAARKNGLIGAAVFVPGVDLPMLTLNQIRLVLRIALAYGHEIDANRLPEVLGVVGAAFGLRAVARELLDLVPVAGWVAKGAIAYGGTKAVGEAARARFSL
jgi:uncharacterized protein (DUF697 family)